MSLPPNPTGSAGDSQPNEEARMRRALGLGDDPRPGEAASRAGERPAPERHALERPALERPSQRVTQRRDPDRRARRFVKDGEVPVVVLSGSREHGAEAPAAVNRLAEAETALDAERGARERAERALQEAHAAVQQLRTQIAHANLAHGEALAAERGARAAAEQARADADAARDALAAEVEALRAAPPPPPPPAASPPPAPAPSTRRARQPKPESEAREPQPVKWWLPSYKAKKRKS